MCNYSCTVNWVRAWQIWQLAAYVREFCTVGSGKIGFP